MFILKKFFVLVLVTVFLAGCSSSSESNSDLETNSDANPLAALTFAENSSDAYSRACYWINDGNNIFGLERLREGNELARNEGKLPVLGVEQAMETVFREGEPQAVEEYQMVKDFCRAIGMPIN
jgi:hypothetical protein